jgi:hypothetical protein
MTSVTMLRLPLDSVTPPNNYSQGPLHHRLLCHLHGHVPSLRLPLLVSLGGIGAVLRRLLCLDQVHSV